MARKGEIIEMVLKTFWEKTEQENPNLNVKIVRKHVIATMEHTTE